MLNDRNLKRLLVPVVFTSLWLVGCTQPESTPTQKSPIAEQPSPEVSLLYYDIDQAQDIEKNVLGAPKPNETISYVFGTDAAHKSHHFANLRALRLDIKRRIDSFRVAGVKISYDTIPGTVTHGKLREYPIEDTSHLHTN
ncbi:hypothetical protein GCM10027422_12090 [Hymenobacter arcticus]